MSYTDAEQRTILDGLGAKLAGKDITDIRRDVPTYDQAYDHANVLGEGDNTSERPAVSRELYTGVRNAALMALPIWIAIGFGIAYWVGR